MADIENTEMGWEYAEGISDKLRNLNSRECPMLDEESTITANTRSKDAYADAQSLLDVFVSAASKDVNNMRTLADNFKKYDNEQKKRNENMN